MDNGIASAWILFLTIWLLPFFVCALRNSVRLMLAYWFVTFLHQAVAFTNVLLFTTLGARGDANTFHVNAVELGQSENFSFSSFGIDQNK